MSDTIKIAAISAPSEQNENAWAEWAKKPYEHLEFSDDGNELISYKKIPDHINSYTKTTVMTKEIFQKCYKKWIMEEE